MAAKSVIEKLWEVNPDAEIWWDSSPLVFDNWRTKMIQQASDKHQMTGWLDHMYHQDGKPEDNLFRGVTTNPPLSFNAIKDNPEYWAKWVDERIKKDRCTDSEVVFWDTYKEIVERGAKAFRPLFEASRYEFGFISGQTDPRVPEDADSSSHRAFLILCLAFLSSFK